MINSDLSPELQFASSQDGCAQFSSAVFKAQVFIITLRALLSGAYTKARGNITKLEIPNLNATPPMPLETLARVNSWIDRWVRLLTFGTKHSCFYRAYALACVLRRYGIAAQFNVGLRNLRADEKNRGHCWLTLKGKPIVLDDDYVRRFYPHMLKEDPGGVTFWAGSNDGNTIKRVKYIKP